MILRIEKEFLPTRTDLSICILGLLDPEGFEIMELGWPIMTKNGGMHELAGYMSQNSPRKILFWFIVDLNPRHHGLPLFIGLKMGFSFAE